jgi:hypothetical protein
MTRSRFDNAVIRDAKAVFPPFDPLIVGLVIEITFLFASVAIKRDAVRPGILTELSLFNNRHGVPGVVKSGSTPALAEQ